MQSQAKYVRILYKNWRGEIAERVIEPQRIWFGTTQWHPTSQWLLHAYDQDRNAERDFALADIQRWEPIT